MTKIAYLISEEDIHGYIDDALDKKRRKAVELCLARDGDLAARVTVYKAQKMALNLLGRSAGPLPPPIRALCRQLAQRLTRRSQNTDIWNKIPPKRASKSSA